MDGEFTYEMFASFAQWFTMTHWCAPTTENGMMNVSISSQFYIFNCKDLFKEPTSKITLQTFCDSHPATLGKPSKIVWKKQRSESNC